MTKWLKIKTITIGYVPSFILIFLSSFLITLTMFALSPYTFSLFWELVMKQPSLFWLNYIPVALFLLFVFFLTQNTPLSVSICTSFFLSLSIINRVKIQLRQSPLLPADLTLISEIVTLLDKFNFTFLLTIITILLFILILIFLSLFFFKNKKLKLPYCIGGASVCLFLGLCANMMWYSNQMLYDSYAVDGNYYFKVNHYLSKGFLYSFLADFNQMKVSKPAGYQKEEFLETKSYQKPEYKNQKKPHIIMIMGEAFTDLSFNENINFDGYEDPLSFYKELIARPDVISGHIIVPNFGGGTADTEFDVLTGCQTGFIDNDLSSYSFIKDHFNGIVRELREIGYDALAIHPGNDWFYNRANVYESMGFQDFLTLENYFNLDRQGIAGYISDEAATEAIIVSFEKQKQVSKNPFFEFCVTIQNHGPFLSKYGLRKNFNTDLSISYDQMNELSNYFRGVADADQQIMDLVTYFEQEKDPVILVYFGDHLPGFPDGLDLFENLQYPIDINGKTEERLNLYKTPFFIWQNESAKKITSRNSLELPKNHTISAAYLGAAVLELAGYESISPFIEFVNDLRKKMPVINAQGYMDGNSHFKERVSEQELEWIEKWKRWGYYKIFDE